MSDARGYFFESFSKRSYKELDLPAEFVQENQSFSKKNVIRGLHCQRTPHAQSKLIRVLSGAILDVVVDLRKNKSTYKKIFTVELSAVARNFLFIPKGFVHGFSVLSESAEILYSCDEYYHPEFEDGILFNDPFLEIDWKIEQSKRIVSDKDLSLPKLASSSLSFE